jgi:hypothetical protein
LAVVYGRQEEPRAQGKVVRWERIAACFEAILTIATMHIWLHKLIER